MTVSKQQGTTSSGNSRAAGGTDPAQRMGAYSSPHVTLQPPQRESWEPREWSGLAEALVTGDERIDTAAPYAVLGGPGTGKSSLLIDALVHYLQSGGDAESVMFVTPTKDSATAINDVLVGALSQMRDFASSRSPVKSVHSWAFAALRTILLQSDREAPRLLTGAEHDAELRLLLAGNAEDGTGKWPDSVRPALPYVGFARQLRDLLLRAEERGIGPEELAELGERFDQDMWVGAAGFMKEFRETRRLAQSISVNASELLHTTLQEMDTGDGYHQLSRWRDNVRLILIDDAHNLDPAAATFLEQFFTPSARVIIAGDPDQCVFHFRGANEEFLERHATNEDRRIVLSVSRRFGPRRATAVNSLTKRLPALPTRIPLRIEGSLTNTAEADAPVAVLRATSGTSERLHIANELRRAHVVEGIEWDDMAVIVRSVNQIASIRRALLTHGVPVMVDQTSIVLAEQPLVRLLLSALEATFRKLNNAEVRVLMESMVGGADPIMVRRLERVLAAVLAKQKLQGKAPRLREDGLPFQSMDCLTAILNDDATATEVEEWTAEFNTRESQVLRDMSEVLAAGRRAQQTGESLEMVLWEIWQATGLDTRLQERALRGGTLGSQADQDLDAVMMLFDLAGDFVERHPNASVRTFTEEVRAQELPTGGRDRGTKTEAVEILPAHAAAGRQWDTVIIAGVQEDLWPAGPTIGGLFGQLELVDYIDRGIEPGTRVSRVAAAVHEERRLFLLALSRADRQATVTCVNNPSVDGGVPSRFIEEIEEADGATCELTPAGEHDRGGDDSDELGNELAEPTDSDLPRVLALEPLIAELRDAVTDSARRYPIRKAAAANLAKMAEAGIFGADPTQWWGLAEPSIMEPLTNRNGEVPLSPSRLDALDGCALRSFYDRNRGVQPQTNPMRIGIIIHAIAQAFVEESLSLDDAQRAGQIALSHAVVGAQFEVDEALRRWAEGINNLYEWISTTMSSATSADPSGQWFVEQMLSTEIGQTSTGEPIVLRGRIDLMYVDGQDRAVVYDFKTGKTPKSKNDAEESRQLSSYQFLVQKRLGKTPYGAHLVYPGARGKKNAVVASQSDPSPEALELITDALRDAGEQVSRPQQIATTSYECQTCEYIAACPAQAAGKRVVQ